MRSTHAILSALLFLGTLASGCASIPTRVARRHAAMFECNEQDVRVSEIDRRRWEGTGNYVANGCGVRAAYYCDGANCVQDGDVVRTNP